MLKDQEVHDDNAMLEQVLAIMEEYDIEHPLRGEKYNDK